MRRNSVYVAFILGGALLGERVSLPSDLQPLCLQADACICATGCAMDITLRTLEFHTIVILLQVLNGAFDRMWENNNKGVSLCAGSANTPPNACLATARLCLGCHLLHTMGQCHRHTRAKIFSNMNSNTPLACDCSEYNESTCAQMQEKMFCCLCSAALDDCLQSFILQEL